MVPILLFLCAACSQAVAPDLESSGPPRIQDDVVRRHAREFEELAGRAPGSQEEQAASYYILGHLQRAGYVVRLDAVPVRNLVSSTNLMALPPSGDDPQFVVAAPYDEKSDRAVAVWLELARALHAVVDDHSVEFVALGAETDRGRAGELGSRRLAKVLLDAEVDPVVVTVSAASTEVGDVAIRGDGPTADGLSRTAARLDLEVAAEGPPLTTEQTVFEQAGFEHVQVHGRASEVGRLVLEYLSGEAD
jgi:hypothetical protein